VAKSYLGNDFTPNWRSYLVVYFEVLNEKATIVWFAMKLLPLRKDR
jgi:hypothetical protein